jgi:replicative DNA helicase
MSDLLQNLQTLISDSSIDENNIVQRLKNLVLENEVTDHLAKDSKSLSDLFSENLSGWQGNVETGNTIKSGFENLDKVIGGFSPGELVVIGGRPAMGKTQLCVNLALNMAKNYPVLYFTFDLSEYLLASRFVSALSDIAVSRIIQHDLADEDKLKVEALASNIHNFRIFLNDSCHNSVSAFKTHCLQQIQENGIKVIFVDYLQMMSSNRYRNSRELEISYISRELKSIARDHNICVIATSQLSRAPEKRSMAAKPLLSDLRDSGAIEQDADKVIFIYRPEYYAIDVDELGNSVARLTELIVAKNRNGSLGTAYLKRNGVFSSFTDFEEYTNEFTFSPGRIDEIENTPF